MQCETFSHIDTETKEIIMKPKIPYISLEVAEQQAAIRNNENLGKEMLQAYHCLECGKYHIGRGSKIVTKQYKKQIAKNVILSGLKIVGKIDLSKIKDKKKK